MCCWRGGEPPACYLNSRRAHVVAVDPRPCTAGGVVSESQRHGWRQPMAPPPFQPPPPMNEQGRLKAGHETKRRLLICQVFGARRILDGGPPAKTQHGRRYQASAALSWLVWDAVRRIGRRACVCKDRCKETIIAIISTVRAPRTAEAGPAGVAAPDSSSCTSNRGERELLGMLRTAAGREQPTNAPSSP